MTIKVKQEKQKAEAQPKAKAKKSGNGKWEKPVLEDVSGKVMAQPYIRFT